MKISEICVRRPVFATMLVGVLVVLGFASYYGLGVDLFPNIDLPIVTVTTTLQGSSPEEIETTVTKPIEEAVNTVSGIDELRSTSREGVSQVVIRFLLERNGEEAAQDVRDRVSTIIKNLPDGTDPPVIVKFDIDAAPVMTVAVSGNRDLREITKIADDQIKQNLETVNGVGAVLIVGGRKRAVNVYLNPSRVEGFGLTVPQVRAALQAQNLEIPGGRVDTGTRELVLRTMGRMPKVEDFQRLIVANIGGRPVMIRDIGWVENGQEEPRSLARFDGNPSVNLVVQKQSGTNTIDVIRKVKERIAQIQGTLPADIKINPIRDQSTFILRSIHEVRTHLILGAVLTSLVVLFFMGNWRSTLIAAVAIPASIIGTFTVMRVLGFTLNNITFLALTLAVGIVIDDAIVVLENIFRHVEEEGSPPRKAAVEATAEIGLAVSATTLSLVVIFLPVAFMSGTVGRFFHSYGITVAFAILFSWFISFTLTPMLSSRFLKLKRAGAGTASSKENRFYRAVSGGYLALLRKALAHRWVVVALTCAVILSTIPAGGIGGQELPSLRRPERVRDLHPDAGRLFAGNDRQGLRGGGGRRHAGPRGEAPVGPDRRRCRRGRHAGNDLCTHRGPRGTGLFPVRHHEGRAEGHGEVPVPARLRPEHIRDRARRRDPADPGQLRTARPGPCEAGILQRPDHGRNAEDQGVRGR